MSESGQPRRPHGSAPWFRQHLRQLHLDFHMPEFPPSALSRLDPRAMVAQFERGRVNLVALFAKDHFGNSFYDTAVGHRHARLSRDFLFETATECRRRGIRTLAYYSVGWDKHAWDANPAWRVLDPKGQSPDANKPYGSVCLNSPYKDELMMPQFREIASYPVDGVFLDTPHGLCLHTPCHCPFCRRKWKADLHVDLPEEPPPTLRDRIVMRTIEQWLAELRALLDAANPESPGLAICLNTASQPHVNRRIRELCDIGVWESQPYGGDSLRHSFVARTARNDLLHTQVMTARFHHGWGDLTLKPTPQLATEFAAMVGNGMGACVGDQVNVDGTLEPVVYEALRESLGIVEAREAALQGAQSVPHAVILLPVPDETLPFLHGLLQEPQGGTTLGAWRGVHKLLVESHIQVDLAYSVLEDDLSRWPMVILPEPGCYQPGVAEKLRAYVEGGGTLVAVGRSLLAAGGFSLEDVLGVRYVEPFTFRGMHFVPGGALADAVPPIPLQLRGQAFKVIRAGAEELAALYYPQTESQPPTRAFRSAYSPPMAERSPYPFATVHRFGRGRAAYVAGSVFEVYWATGHPWLRQFMAALLRHVGPPAPYEVEAPGTVEANLMRQGGSLVLNLIRYAVGHPSGAAAIPVVEQADPARDVRCAVRAVGVRSVTLESGQSALPFEQQGDICRFIVPEVKYLATVRIDTAAS